MIRLLNIKENPKSSNSGEPIDDWEHEFKMYRMPWCAIVQSIKAREGKVKSPIVWSARARDFIVKGYAWKLSDLIYDRYIPKPGDFRVKSRRGGNHIDLFISWDTLKQEGIVIGGNVSDAVTLRKVTLKSMIADGTTHIIQVTGCYIFRNENLTLNYKEWQGIATYYADSFNGRRTSSGEIFDNNKMTAAHKTLPFGTYVIVTNPKNNKYVIVRINDRGPFNQYEIDLSKAAADKIGIARGNVILKIAIK
jgi:rare lipoprotein A